MEFSIKKHRGGYIDFTFFGKRYIGIFHKDKIVFFNDAEQNYGKEFMQIYDKSRKYTLTMIERMHSLYSAIHYIHEAGIKGDVVECGVWKGGSMMVAALTLQQLNKERNLWLYDTFNGSPMPSDLDIKTNDKTSFLEEWKKNQREDHNDMLFVTLREVKENMHSTGYPKNKINYVVGKVEDTLLRHKPQKIALLRLDTDFYTSTIANLIHLFPLISDGGVIIIDDYNGVVGCKKAVDEYLRHYWKPVMLHRIDNYGVIFIK